jgi:hypothetical protein
MNITVVVPSDEFRSYAGARIRYGRLIPELERLGIELRLQDIGKFDPRSPDYDVLLISKCQDARAVITAAAASERAMLVGVDLFDDYFSQRHDSRLATHRSWLRQLTQFCDFALCSTGRMADVVGTYRSGLPTHVLNDPAPARDSQSLPKLLARKSELARATDVLRVAWFGVGDNPHFPVGLADLSAYSPVLAELARSGMTVDLTILTNARALSADGLSQISRIPIRANIRQWTEAAEREVLEEANLAFLPVSFQPFSIAKSLNRAVTALSSGCQVLSVGYPLYASLEPLIYRDARAFMDDFAQGALRLSVATVNEYRDRIAEFASAEHEARGLAGFLELIRRPSHGSAATLVVIHGYSTPADAHRLTRELGGLSVASPFCTLPLDFDVIFRSDLLNSEMHVSPEACERLLPRARQLLDGRRRLGGRQYSLLGREPNGSARHAARESSSAAIGVQLAAYAAVMAEIERRMIESFGPIRPIFSESSQLPFQLASAAA